MKKIVLAAMAAMASAISANAVNPAARQDSAAMAAFTPLTDTNLQIFYDFGSDRKYVTTTYEMFHGDAWGSTFFFVDIDFNYKNDAGTNVGPGGAYTEISRSLNFWKNTRLKDFSLQVEYNGGLGAPFGGYTINHAFLAGANYLFHSADYRYTLSLALLYKGYIGMKQHVPMQFTTVWGCQDLFGAKGLRFSGFLDIWEEGGKCLVVSEPQLWYSAGQWFGCPNLNVGGEVELAYNFVGDGFHCRPCLGVKWVF